MSRKIDREGRFLATPVEWGVKESQNGAIGVGFKFHIKGQWDYDNEIWDDWSRYEVECFGTWWIIKKDGLVNEKPVEQLCQALGWDGSIDSLERVRWDGQTVQIDVKGETYNGAEYFKASWMYGKDAVPNSGGVGSLQSGELKSLSSRFGSQLRAIAGNVKRNQPAGSAPPPPPADKETLDDVPF